MPLPDLYPETSASGISVDPKTLDRVVAPTRRADGSLRKELKIRPGFTPQEDVSRFRGSRQQTLDKTALPKGHIMGWIAPSSETQQKKKPGASGSGSSAIDTAGMSKAAAKNAKRSAKKREEKAKALEEKIREAWDEDDEDDLPPNKDKAVEPKDNEAVEEITEQVDKLNVSS